MQQPVIRNLVFNNSNNNNGIVNQRDYQQNFLPVYSDSPAYMSQNLQYDSRTVNQSTSLTERPTMRPPPVPKNVQNSHNNDPNGVQFSKEDLPPPPSPPQHDYIFHSQFSHERNIRKPSSPPPPIYSHEHLVDELPPPPDDFVHDIKSYDVKRNTVQSIVNVSAPTPPPPPAPPLPNFNFSSVVLNSSNLKSTSVASSQKNSTQVNEFSNARNGVLDAIKNSKTSYY